MPAMPDFVALLHEVEVGFVNTALRTNPIIGDVFQSGAGRQAGIRITEFFVIDISTSGTDIFFIVSHDDSLVADLVLRVS
jgi:hypothetical protein